MAEPVDLADLKAFARVDYDDEDTLIASLGIAAREFVEQATGGDFSSAEAGTVPEKAKLAIKALAAHWFEHRTPIEAVGAAVVPMHVRSLIAQLRGGVLEPAEETAA